MSSVPAGEPKKASHADFGRGFRDMQKQVLHFQKSTFDSSFEAFAAFQDQQGKFFTDLMQRADALPEEGRELATKWIETLRRARDDYKSSVDTSYELMLQYFERLDAEAQSGQPQSREAETHEGQSSEG